MSSLKVVPNSDRAPIIELRRISKVYHMGEIEVRALREVDFIVRAGEMVAIMGASGSGKSTMLNLIGTLDRPTEGEYLLDGEPVQHLDEFELASLRNRKIGFVFQSFNLLARDNALENVELPMVYAGERRSSRRKKALAALERVGLSDRVDHLPNQLSGGQQQRVSIARAIVNEPLLLLADEPTGALDSATTKQVMELFVDLHHQGMTVVIVTHDPNIAAYAQRVVSFKDGVIVSDETKPAKEHKDTDADDYQLSSDRARRLRDG
jgi:putative ABC transport system ATP-binding protein